MAPTSSPSLQAVGVQPRAPSPTATFGNWRDSKSPEAFIVESWSQGFMFGALLIMAVITVVNMKRRVLLHKLILLEVSMSIGAAEFSSTIAANHDDAALTGHVTWNLLFHEFRWVRLLSVSNCCLAPMLIFCTQRCRLAQNCPFLPGGHANVLLAHILTLGPPHLSCNSSTKCARTHLQYLQHISLLQQLLAALCESTTV